MSVKSYDECRCTQSASDLDPNPLCVADADRPKSKKDRDSGSFTLLIPNPMVFKILCSGCIRDEG